MNVSGKVLCSDGGLFAVRRFFLERERIFSEIPMLTGPDVRHVRTVLRLKPGDELFLFDGEGLEYRAKITDTTSKAIVLSVGEAFPSASESPAQITIGQCLLKARKMDGVVRQLTELGVHALVPVVAERTVPRPKTERWAEKERRWKAIAWEALKQCGRSQTPRLDPPVSFEALLRASQPYDHKFIFHSEPPSKSTFTTHTGQTRDGLKVLALIGPEGGFTRDEVHAALGSGFCCVSLGPRVLKADTAVVAACTVLQYLFGDLKHVLKKP
jgi:16S rRNA (uracil1498-N3)-methyltransferase